MKHVRSFIALVVAAVLAGCASSTIESRRKDRPAAYSALSAEQRALVDQGQVRVGMSQDAVYIAWGEPKQKTQAEGAEGLTEMWIYHDSTLDNHRYWAFRERTDSKTGRVYLDRTLENDFQIREYVSAEITFANGVVKNWRTRPMPVSDRHLIREY
jgi:hypothetical protein